MEKLLEGIDRVKKDGLREKLKASRDQIAQNREMVRLDTDLPLPLPLEELVVRPRLTELVSVLERCEFKTLLEEIRIEASRTAPAQLTQADLLF